MANLAGVSLDSDGIFTDGYSLQMATMTGSVDGGLRRHPQRAHLSGALIADLAVARAGAPLVIG